MYYEIRSRIEGLHEFHLVIGKVDRAVVCAYVLPRTFDLSIIEVDYRRAWNCGIVDELNYIQAKIDEACCCNVSGVVAYLLSNIIYYDQDMHRVAFREKETSLFDKYTRAFVNKPNNWIILNDEEQQEWWLNFYLDRLNVEQECQPNMRYKQFGFVDILNSLYADYIQYLKDLIEPKSRPFTLRVDDMQEDQRLNDFRPFFYNDDGTNKFLLQIEEHRNDTKSIAIVVLKFRRDEFILKKESESRDIINKPLFKILEKWGYLNVSNKAWNDMLLKQNSILKEKTLS